MARAEAFGIEIGASALLAPVDRIVDWPEFSFVAATYRRTLHPADTARAADSRDDFRWTTTELGVA